MAEVVVMERDEKRISHNLDRYFEACRDYGYFQSRANAAKQVISDAYECLKSAGGDAEIEKYKVRVP
jgi:hypothetical protein